jgi:tRNA(fMet)-specific endonuclease VapC
VSLFLLDTDHVTLYEIGHPSVIRNLAIHVADSLAISVITVEEQLTGWQQALRQTKDPARREMIYRRMAMTVESLSEWLVLPMTQIAMTRHAELLRKRLNVGTNDLKIAAIALDQQAIVVTRNQRDFGRVAGLTCVDWSL